MNVTGLRDWARLGGGGINAEGNAILYKVSYVLLDSKYLLSQVCVTQVLLDAADLASARNLSNLRDAWRRNATSLKSRFNDVFWDDSQGMYLHQRSCVTYLL